MTRKVIVHYVEVFAAAFAITLLFNAEHLLDAHGLGALKSAGVAAVIVAAKAGLAAVRATVAGKTPPGPQTG